MAEEDEACYLFNCAVIEQFVIHGSVTLRNSHTSSMTVQIRIVDGDLLDQDVAVIVNALNRNIIPWWLLLPQGVSGAIKKRAGHAPFRELAKKGSIPLGGAVQTSDGRRRGEHHK